MDFADAEGTADDEGWETEDEMDAEQDDSDLTFIKHTGDIIHLLFLVYWSTFFFLYLGCYVHDKSVYNAKVCTLM